MNNRPAARLYSGRVMHMRMLPVRHQFRYRVFSLLIDIDRTDAVLATSRLMRHNRFGVLSFHECDHGRRDGSALRPWVEQHLAAHDLPAPARIELLCFPRILGYGFNPLSVYFCYDERDRMTSVLYEVKNTYGDQVAYVLPCRTERLVDHHVHDKEMYVSPFIELEQQYRFTISPPDARLSVRIKQSGADGETLIATHNGTERPFRDSTLLALLATHPLMTLKVVAAIHFEAFRLYRKGVKFRRYNKETAFRQGAQEH